MDFDSGPPGSVSVYRFDDYPPALDSPSLPHYWDVFSTMPDDSFSVEITFDYIESEVADAGWSEHELMIAYHDSTWHSMATIIDTVNNEATVYATQFGLFAVSNDASAGSKHDVFEVPSPGFYLSQNYPNPFEHGTVVRYSLPMKSDMNLTIYDMLGRRVKNLAKGMQHPGQHCTSWDGLDHTGRSVSSGVYWLCLQAGDQVATRKVVLIR